MRCRHSSVLETHSGNTFSPTSYLLLATADATSSGLKHISPHSMCTLPPVPGGKLFILSASNYNQPPASTRASARHRRASTINQPSAFQTFSYSSQPSSSMINHHQQREGCALGAQRYNIQSLKYGFFDRGHAHACQAEYIPVSVSRLSSGTWPPALAPRA